MPSDLTPTRANLNLSSELDIQNHHTVEPKLARNNHNGVSATEGAGTTVLVLCSVCRHVLHTYDIAKWMSRGFFLKKKTEIFWPGKPNSFGQFLQAWELPVYFTAWNSEGSYRLIVVIYTVTEREGAVESRGWGVPDTPPPPPARSFNQNQTISYHVMHLIQLLQLHASIHYSFIHRYDKTAKKIRLEQFEFSSLMKYTNSNNNSNAFLPPSKVILVAW